MSDPVEVYQNPKLWPRWVRRAFILTAPVSYPLWLASILCGWVALIIIGTPIVAVIYAAFLLWSEIIPDAITKVKALWSLPTPTQRGDHD